MLAYVEYFDCFTVPFSRKIHKIALWLSRWLLNQSGSEKVQRSVGPTYSWKLSSSQKDLISS